MPLAVRRSGRPDFAESFASLREAVVSACDPAACWEARVLAGIGAALEFAGEEPEMSHVVIVQGRRERRPRGDREREVVAHFAELLSTTAPPEIRHPVSTDEGIVEAIATLIRGHLQAGTERELVQRAPDLVYLVLMPFLGIDGARRWADRA